MEHDVLMGLQDHPLIPDWVQEMEDWDFQLSADEEDSDEDLEEEDESDESSSGETTEESDDNEQEMD